jgi:chromosome segregation ATPase
MNTPRLTTALTLLVLVPACSSAYYGAMETFGVHKRDILVDRVEEARDGQEQAKEQFASALEHFTAVVGLEGGDLQEQYGKLKAELERSEERAGDVTDRIDSVESVADALFDEWEAELDQYSDPKLRRSSEEQLKDTRRNYKKMLAAMRRAESKMEPVLTVFRDQVLFMKHNLNARALASLEGVAAELDTDVAALIRDMQTSIDEANAFISRMES